MSESHDHNDPEICQHKTCPSTEDFEGELPDEEIL